MDIAWGEFINYKGLREMDSPLKEKIPVYFETSSAKGLNYKHTEAWCGAYIVWCFEQLEEYKNINNPKSAAAFGWLSKNWKNGEDCEAFVGATIIFSFSHVAFIVGENIAGTKYVYLGGNQGDMITLSPNYKYDGSVFYSYTKKNGTKVYKKFRGFFKPKGYVIKEKDKLNKNDEYATLKDANNKLKQKTQDTSKGESSR